jgi:alpha/beta superfamily hydrolase
MNLVTFDFAGSGISEGHFVSLGFYEAMDVEVVTNYIRKQSYSN